MLKIQHCLKHWGDLAQVPGELVAAIFLLGLFSKHREMRYS